MWFQLQLKICALLLTSFSLLCIKKLLLANMQQTEATRAEPVFVAPTQKFIYFMLKVSLLLFCVYINFIIKFCVSMCRTPTNEFLVDVNISILVFSVYLYNIYVYIYICQICLFFLSYTPKTTQTKMVLILQ